LKADPNIGKKSMFLNAAGKFDLAKLKNTWLQLRKHNIER
jgi:hypothetical protein